MVVKEGLTRTWPRWTMHRRRARSNVAALIKSKINEVARINIVQAQVEEMYFMFYLEFRNAALSRGISHGLPTKSQCSHSLKIQVR
jgi:hypothetical protein